MLSFALQMDPDHFESPSDFDPGRFGADRRGSIRTGAYLPFGLGPRRCIGATVSMAEAKAFLFHLLRAFRLEPSERTPVPLQLRCANGLVSPTNFKLTKVHFKEE